MPWGTLNTEAPGTSPLCLFHFLLSLVLPRCPWLPGYPSLGPCTLSSSSHRVRKHTALRFEMAQDSLTYSMHSAGLFLVTLFAFFWKEPNSGLYLRHPTTDTVLYPGAFSPEWLLVIRSPVWSRGRGTSTAMFWLVKQTWTYTFQFMLSVVV